MNISSHSLLSTKWQIGQFRPDGSSYASTNYSLTHFFTLSTIGFRVFPLPSIASELFGTLVALTFSGVPIYPNYNVPLLHNVTLFDGAAVHNVSKPFTYILY